MVQGTNCMKEMYYKWSLAEDRKQIFQWIMSKFNFPNYVGCLDGTLNPLTFEPQCQDASDYSGRKYGYSLTTLVVNDDNQRITYYLARWPGSTHDNHIFKNLHLFQDFYSYFSECEYLLGDLAFKCFSFIIGVYK